jgi:hypothetical protein
VRLNLGVVLGELGQVDEAIAEWQRVLREQPDAVKGDP